MGEIVLAAKCTHVPTMLMSEQDGPVKGKRKAAIDGHVEIASRARALGADTVVICDTHWVINAGFHINANKRFQGMFTSNEFPQFIQDMPYEYEGNPELGDAIADEATREPARTRTTLTPERRASHLRHLSPPHLFGLQHQSTPDSLSCDVPSRCMRGANPMRIQ